MIEFKNFFKILNRNLILAHSILLILQIIFWDFIVDDAFISFRYAQNLYYHQQLAFNIDETPVEGYSNFLWILLISINYIFNIDVIIFSKVLGLIFCHSSVLVLYKLAFLIHKDKYYSNWIVVLYVLTPNVALWSVGGLETSLFSLILLISIYFFVIDITKRKNSFFKISPLFFFFLSLTRPEGAILFLITGIYYFYLFLRKRNIFMFHSIIQLISFGALYLVFYIPYFIWRILYYKSFIPQTFLAKMGDYSIPSLYSRVLSIEPLIFVLIPSFVLILFYIFRNFKSFFSDNILLYLFILILTGSAIILSVYNWMPGFRYTVPYIPLLYLLLPTSINFLIIFKDKFVNKINLWKAVKIITLLIICLSNFVLIFNFYSHALNYSSGLRDTNFVLGKWINKYASKDATLAIKDVGAIPYYAGIRTIDIHPDSLLNPYYAQHREDVDYVFNQNITIFIFTNGSWHDNYILNDLRFKNNYKFLFHAQLFYKDEPMGEYIYNVYLYKGYYIPESAINELINTSPRFYK